jgi:lysozyme
MVSLRRSGAILASLVLMASGVSQKGKQPLANEPSREKLAQYAASLEPPTRAYPYEFEFPGDVRNEGIFGIDVSHYQDTIDWERIANQGIRFVYIKATQGEEYYDPIFERNWKGAARIEGEDPLLHRGAYHFMTAKGSAELQAQNFLSTVGTVEANDLPPCLDLEWDWLSNDQKYVLDPRGHKVDQWAALSSAEIVERVSKWLGIVQHATGKKPIVYTARSWWLDRIGTSRLLSGYSFWIADFTSKSLGRERPSVPEELSWSLWQLTDRGILRNGAIKTPVDTTVFNSTAAAFDKQFGYR